VSDPSAGREAEARLGELLEALEAKKLDAAAVEFAGGRVATALARLTREVAPDELARVIDLHACVRQAVSLRRVETGDELRRVRAGRDRLSHLTRPSDSSGSLDIRA